MYLSRVYNLCIPYILYYTIHNNIIYYIHNIINKANMASLIAQLVRNPPAMGETWV